MMANIFCLFLVFVCPGVSELVRVVIQCGHLVGDTIVQGSATSHMVPVEQADGELTCVRERERLSSLWVRVLTCPSDS